MIPQLLVLLAACYVVALCSIMGFRSR